MSVSQSFVGATDNILALEVILAPHLASISFISFYETSVGPVKIGLLREL